MKKEKRISYRAGITRSPSDFLCPDGDLAECVNLTSDNEELKTMVAPAAVFGSDRELTFVHQLPGGGKNYILFDGGTASLYYKHGDGGSETFFKQIDSQSLNGIEGIGNTLVVSTDKGLEYFLWKGTAYKSLGGKIPEPEVRFRVCHSGEVKDRKEKAITDFLELGDDNRYHLVSGKQGEWNDYILGTYAKLKKQARTEGKFTRTFLLRYCLKLYDGRETMHSSPIAVFPSFGRNLLLNSIDFIANGSFDMILQTFKLDFSSSTDYSEWSDIVKNIVVYATDEIENYKLTGDVPFKYYVNDETYMYCHGVWGYTRGTGDLRCRERSLTKTSVSEENPYVIVETLKSQEESVLLDEVKNASVFYKLCDLPPTPGYGYLSLNPSVMENLTTQTQMGDEYFSHSSYAASFTKSYNGRLHLGGVSRSFFDGFSHYNAHEEDAANQHDVYVVINTSDGDVVVTRHIDQTFERIWDYFYYPDPRAKKAVIVRNGSKYEITLSEHPGLNGAVGVHSPYSSIVYDSSIVVPVVTGGMEQLRNTLLVSEADNPFVFKAEGNVTVGNGDVVGMASQTMALGQEEHGTHPLTVFTTMGVYALRLNSEGVYVSADIFSREVCLHKESITETDGAVYFVSKKGLMVVVGSQVKCVSEQMDGRTVGLEVLPGLDAASLADGSSAVTEWAQLIGWCEQGGSFRDFVRDSSLRIGYDYTDSRLLLLNRRYRYAYVFNMKDGCITKYVMPSQMVRAVNAYPDTLLQDGSGTVYSLYGKNEEEDGTLEKAFLVTRPMKLGGVLTVASLRELVNVGVWNRNDGEVVKTDVWVSDDLLSWHLLGSRFGSAAKYFRVGLYMKMLPTSRLSGTVLREQERRDENYRMG